MNRKWKIVRNFIIIFISFALVLYFSGYGLSPEAAYNNYYKNRQIQGRLFIDPVKLTFGEKIFLAGVEETKWGSRLVVPDVYKKYGFLYCASGSSRSYGIGKDIVYGSYLTLPIDDKYERVIFGARVNKDIEKIIIGYRYVPVLKFTKEATMVTKNEIKKLEYKQVHVTEFQDDMFIFALDASFDDNTDYIGEFILKGVDKDGNIIYEYEEGLSQF